MEYGEVFARVYDLRWGDFPRALAPHLLAFHRARPIAAGNHPVLDLGCGTGHLAELLAAEGLRVTGVDLSPHMIAGARERLRSFVDTGAVTLVEANVIDVATAVEQPGHGFALIVSTFNALNHLPDLDALARTVKGARELATPGGAFVFDLNTRQGLERWRQPFIDDHDDTFVVARSDYEIGDPRAVMRVVAFHRRVDGSYDRCDEEIGNTVFDLADVLRVVRDAGWNDVHVARIDALETPVSDPESLRRAFIVAHA